MKKEGSRIPAGGEKKLPRNVFVRGIPEIFRLLLRRSVFAIRASREERP